MATETPNLKLKKPAGTDLVDITVLNGNMDILDTTFKAIDDRLKAIEGMTRAEGQSYGGM